MSAVPLRAFTPDTAAPSEPFRSDFATIRQVFDWFRDNNPKPSKSVKASREHARLRSLFAADYGDWLYTDCKPYLLFSWIIKNTPEDEDDDGKKNNTRRRWNSTIQRPFNLAAEMGLIQRNPFKGCKFPEGKQGRDWTDEEFRAMLRRATPAGRRFLVGIRFSGMRPGEQRTVKKPNLRSGIVDADNKTHGFNRIVLGDHKTVGVTKEARRIVVNHVLRKLLDWQLRNNPPSVSHLWLNSFWRPWTMGALSKLIVRLREKTGLPADVKLHGGRHTFATNALMNECDLIEVMQLLGHRSIQTTKRYIHLIDKDDHMTEVGEKAITSKKKKPK